MARNHQFSPQKSVYPLISFRNPSEYALSNTLNRSANGKNSICGFAKFREISKPDIRIKARRTYPMERLKIKREIVAVLMESPLYFTIPLKKRLEFIMFFSQQPVYNHISELKKHQIIEIVT
jgi:hypothetical protein